MDFPYFACFSVFFRSGHMHFPHFPYFSVFSVLVIWIFRIFRVFPCFYVFFRILRTYAFDFPYFSDIFRIVPGVMTMDGFKPCR